MMHTMVKEFHNTFGALVSDVPVLPDTKTREMRKKILEEEFNEYYEAVATKDGIEMADALADICYVASGTAVSYGIVPKSSYEHTKSSFPKKTPDFFVAVLRKSFANYMFAEALNDLKKIKEALNDILFACSQAASFHNIPLQKVFNEVHRSNMSKLDENGKPVHREDGKILKSALYTPPDIRKVLGDNWVVDGF